VARAQFTKLLVWWELFVVRKGIFSHLSALGSHCSLPAVRGSAASDEHLLYEGKNWRISSLLLMLPVAWPALPTEGWQNESPSDGLVNLFENHWRVLCLPACKLTQNETHFMVGHCRTGRVSRSDLLLLHWSWIKEVFWNISEWKAQSNWRLLLCSGCKRCFEMVLSFKQLQRSFWPEWNDFGHSTLWILQ